jgi:eukaryotic-like serine/threonine-protein kinase
VRKNEADPRVGTRLGNYLLLGVIGRGGMGVVYRAEHAYLRRPVAVKVLHKSYFDQPQGRERFLREAQAAGVIDHPNIVGIHDFGEAPDGTVFLVMAHVDGVSLDRVLSKEELLPLFRSLVITSQLTRALGAAHDKGIIHHDLKPDNIMLQPRVGRRQIVRDLGDEGGSLVEPEGTFDFVTILDFGAAKYLDQAMAGSGVVIGTPTYMAPETARDGVADARSDIYALGVVLYEMLTGTVPFDGDEATEIMLKHLRDPVTPPRLRCPQAEITSEAERVIMKALAKHPAQRYQNMRELHADLEHCYGSIKFRRNLAVLPAGTPVEALRRPIPLTQVKRRPGEDTPAPPTPPAPAAPAPPSLPAALPSVLIDTGSSSPLLLTRRKSGRHRTLPFGAPTLDEGPASPEPGAPPDNAPRRKPDDR